MFQSKAQRIFFKHQQPCSIGEEVFSNPIIMIKSDFIVDMIKETKGVRNIGTKPEEGQRVEIKKDLQKN